MDKRRNIQISRSVLFIDACMNHLIRLGGITVIVAVMGIFIFIFGQILPLFQQGTVQKAVFAGAETKESDQTRQAAIQIPESSSYSILGCDEWGALPFLIDARGRPLFLSLPYVLRKGGQRVFEYMDEIERFQRPVLSWLSNHDISALSYNQGSQELIYGTERGHFSIVKIHYTRKTTTANKVQVIASLEPNKWYDLGKKEAPIRRIAYGDGGKIKLVAALQEDENRLELYVLTLRQEHSLLGKGEIMVDKRYRLTPYLLKSSGKPNSLLVNKDGDSIIVGTDKGDVYYFKLDKGSIQLLQRFRPFQDLADQRVQSIDFLLGDVSLIITHPEGYCRGYSLYVPGNGFQRLFGHTKSYPRLPGKLNIFTHSERHKVFLLGSGKFLSIHLASNVTTRWEKTLPYSAKKAVLSNKYNTLFVLDQQNRLHVYGVNDPHPESALRTYFGANWYEGAAKAEFKWQSTGSTEDFEPKLSMIPLILGSLKATLYTLLFSIPIALLAALYTSQFLERRFRGIIKSSMEIMASVPSVILGFIGALWLAPLLETRIPALLVFSIFLPLLTVVLFIPYSYGANRFSGHWLFKSGYEFVYLLPLIILTWFISAALGPLLEQWLFVATDVETGSKVSDFRLWWAQVSGKTFQQRNALIVGIMMGFAVIPIIFTIAEDALSNVPTALKSGSLALGATPWQTAIKIVLPTASAGIFSALMIGLGRAVGETMIVLMATGNTPIMDMDIFSGMRTLSANIAVELPEAAHGGTLYRSLYLGAMILFVLTFVINTSAELLRHYLRTKYKTI